MVAGRHIEALEARVKAIIKQSAELKRRVALLEARLLESNTRLVKQAAQAKQWEKERDWLRGRLKHILGELELIEVDGARDQDKKRGGTG